MIQKTPKAVLNGLGDRPGGAALGYWNRSARLLFFYIALAAGLVLASLPQVSLAADIRVTPHNLAQKRKAVEAEEVCVFCHTPQLSANSIVATPARPAWQPALSENHEFAMYDDIGRRQFGKLAIGSQSLACLSCHDATQAFSVTNSLSDHPFGVPYRGFNRGWEKSQAEEKAREKEKEDTNVPFRMAQHLKSLDDFRLPSKGKIENRAVWWVSAGGVSAVRTRSDLPLYARMAEGGEIPYIECSSCHDPHVARPLFLRVPNDNSKLCLTCHDK